MLTINNVIDCCREGIGLRFREDRCQYKGEYDPSTKEVTVYTPYVEDARDQDMTILYGFINALHYIKDVHLSSDLRDTVAEQIAEETLEEDPDVLTFLKELYGIN